MNKVFKKVQLQILAATTGTTRKRERMYNYKYCTYCHQNVSKSTYYQHRALLLAQDSCFSSSSASDSLCSESDDEIQPQALPSGWSPSTPS